MGKLSEGWARSRQCLTTAAIQQHSSEPHLLEDKSRARYYPLCRMSIPGKYARFSQMCKGNPNTRKM